MSQNSYKQYEVWQPLLLASLVIVGMLLGYQLNDSGDRYSLIEDLGHIDSQNASIGRVEEVIRFIDHKYAFDIKDDKLVNVALSAVINELDPFSSYIPPSSLEGVNNRVSGIYKGIGIETLRKDNQFCISKVYQNSPAKLAGIQVFDVIKAINGIALDENVESLSTVKDSIQSSDLVLSIARDDELFDVEIKEEKVDVSGISQTVRLDSTTTYISLDRFSKGVYKDFMDSLELYGATKPDQDIIIDVRGNLGGLLPEVSNILSQFFDQKDLSLVTTRGLNQKEEKVVSTGKPFFRFGNIAVLIDDESASASEILAGALQDHDRAVILGEQSFGKGLVQEQYNLKNKGALRLTVAEYFLPTGRCIQRKEYNPFSKTDTLDQFEFNSINLNRTLTSGEGIIPDLKVDKSTFVRGHQLSNALLDFTYELVLYHKDRSLDFWKDYIADPQTIWLSSDTDEKTIMPTKYEAIQALSYYSDQLSITDLTVLMQDKAVLKALDQLKKENILEL